MGLNKWTRPKDYFGREWPEYYVFLGRSRDSSIIELSNFAMAMKRLGGESETVFAVRESHWAAGWVEWIAIHESDTTALELAGDVLDQLEQYPILDDDDVSRRECEAFSKTWEYTYADDFRGRILDHFGDSDDDFLLEYIDEVTPDTLRELFDHNGGEYESDGGGVYITRWPSMGDIEEVFLREYRRATHTERQR